MRQLGSSILVVLLALVLASPVWAGEEEKADEAAGAMEMGQVLERVKQLEKQLAELVQAREDEELEKLRLEADTEAAASEDQSEKLEEKTYIMASRSLQMLNPEISVSGDFIGQAIFDKDMNVFYAGADDRSGMVIRALDMHIQSTLDPFSFTKIAIGFAPPDEVSLEELFITWTGVIPNCSLTVGRFRQLFGVLNRWHEHDLDQVGYPLVVDQMLGEGGLTQSGVSLSWNMPPLWAHANELTIQLTNSSNDHLFAGEFYSIPSGLIHLKSYYDLNEDTYLELGLSGLFGATNRRGVPAELEDPDDESGLLLDENFMPTVVAGADLTVFWQPLKQARYQSVVWRTEGMWARQDTAERVLDGWGVYSYLQVQAGAAWFIGLRGDLVQPLWDEEKLLWQAVPYVTFWQSEFVYLRLEARHGEVFAQGHDTRVMLQVNWAAGPHKHEKY